jgi:uncharacterized protein (TIGR00730 family)
MGEVAKTLVSLSGPDSVHGIIPEALVRYERDPTYRSKALVSNGNGTNNNNNKTTNGTSANGTATPDSSSKETAAAQQQQQQQEEEEHLPVPEEAVFGRTTIVKDMHTRKRLMAQEVIEGGPGSGFIALSGGYGTVEELFETATWNQLGIHNKGIVLLNINGFYDGLLQWIDKSVEEGFIHGKNRHILVEAKTPEEAIQALRDYKVSEAVYKLSWGNQ